MAPIAGKKSKSQGFTLIELLVTIAVAVILITIAAPNFSSLLKQSRLAAEYNSILSGIIYSRSEAVKSRSNISASLVNDGSGWVLEAKDSDGEVMRKFEYDGESDASVFVIEFNSLGRLVSCTDGSLNDMDPCIITVGNKYLEIGPSGKAVAKEE